MEQTLNIIDKENAFMYYDKIFTLKRFWDLMEENNVNMQFAGRLAVKIIDRAYSGPVFSRIKNFGNFISEDSFKFAFSDETYNDFIKKKANCEKYLTPDEQKAITKVLKNTDALTMLDYDTFLENRFPEEEYHGLKKNIDDLKLRLENKKENLCVPAYFLAIYNTYVTGLILKNAVGRFVSEIMQDNENIYYTSAKIITKLSKKKNALRDREEFWEAANNFNETHPTNKTPKEFNYFQMQRICWTAYSLNISDFCTENELLYILLKISSYFVKNALAGLNAEEYKAILESELKLNLPEYVL